MKKQKNIIRKIFGGINITWPGLIIFSIVMGVYTALMAMWVPDGNSFHDIAVTAEWWVLPAVFIMVNSKKPLESALKVFVFFLISQPIVYLVQVPFSSMGWGLFGYYWYWFVITLFTFPAAFVGWYIREDKWYSGVILSLASIYLIATGFLYAVSLPTNFPNHLVSIIYCFAMVLLFIFGILKSRLPRIIVAIASVVTLIVMILMRVMYAPFEVYDNSFLSEHDIVFVDEPYVSYFSGDGMGNVEVVKVDDGYNFKITGERGHNYKFSVTDDFKKEYVFKYYYDNAKQAVEIEYVGVDVNEE